jgi:hypothetical protein
MSGMKVEPSYRRVHYGLRPNKQVERRMILHTLSLLGQDGFPIADYQYTGLGSIYFIDFIVFHKLLGIKRMVSIERDSAVRRRVKFNRPFRFIEIKMGSAGEFIPMLSHDRLHLVWLDYDQVLSRQHLEDVSLASSVLSPGSILVVTIDIEPPGSDSDGPAQWRDHFFREASDYLGSFLSVADFAQSNLMRVNVDILSRAVRAGLSGRPDVQFQPLYSFVYADGHEMLTIGGMIATEVEQRKLNGGSVHNAPFLRLDLSQDPYRIKVPLLTRKEQLLLDSLMPCPDNWTPKEFEFSSEEAERYREIYSYFPIYAELLV